MESLGGDLGLVLLYVLGSFLIGIFILSIMLALIIKIVNKERDWQIFISDLLLSIVIGIIGFITAHFLKIANKNAGLLFGDVDYLYFYMPPIAIVSCLFAIYKNKIFKKVKNNKI